ncbi:MAG: hypoxanthine phosphoribosyltransferase [Candidatus Aminicenantes bacterium]|nr:hypoxanthine phosphoribosyltransferase [Candidatus Aminicenantes bacterium]
MNQEIDYENVVIVPEKGITGTKNDIAILSEILSDKKNRIDRVLIPETCLKRRIQALAQEICNAYKNAEELILVIILKGAFVFASDLGREIYKICGLQGPEIRFDFIKAVTYGKEIKHSEEKKRKVKIELKPQNLEGKDVLLIEDIVDQGFTVFEIKQKLLEEENLNSLKICALLNKILINPTKEVRVIKNKLILDYLGFEIPDRWIAGYGIDAGEDFRHLPFIISVKENYYLNK